MHQTKTKSIFDKNFPNDDRENKSKFIGSQLTVNVVAVAVAVIDTDTDADADNATRHCLQQPFSMIFSRHFRVISRHFIHYSWTFYVC